MTRARRRPEDDGWVLQDSDEELGSFFWHKAGDSGQYLSRHFYGGRERWQYDRVAKDKLGLAKYDLEHLHLDGVFSTNILGTDAVSYDELMDWLALHKELDGPILRSAL